MWKPKVRKRLKIPLIKKRKKQRIPIKNNKIYKSDSFAAVLNLRRCFMRDALSWDDDDDDIDDSDDDDDW